jgi:hypothetical protein
VGDMSVSGREERGGTKNIQLTLLTFNDIPANVTTEERRDGIAKPSMLLSGGGAANPSPP